MRKRSEHWRERRVSFLVSDQYHTITPVAVKMPVRVKNRGENKTVYEGPIAAKWGWVKKQIENTQDLVGVLYATDEQIDFGRIDWLEQSEVNEIEAGADRLNEEGD